MKRSPRRLQAALALRRRASFYSSLNSEYSQAGGAGSRHWARAESQVLASFLFCFKILKIIIIILSTWI